MRFFTGYATAASPRDASVLPQPSARYGTNTQIPMARLARRIRQSSTQRSHPRAFIVFLNRHYPQAGTIQLIPAAGRKSAQSTNASTASSVRSSTGRVQPVHQQRSRNPQPSVPAVSHAIEASPRKTPKIPQPPQQNPSSRASIRLPGRKL